MITLLEDKQFNSEIPLFIISNTVVTYHMWREKKPDDCVIKRLISEKFGILNDIIILFMTSETLNLLSLLI